MYELFLNGKFYGAGGVDYISQLINDYVVTCEMYGRKEVDLKVVRVDYTDKKVVSKEDKK